MQARTDKRVKCCEIDLQVTKNCEIWELYGNTLWSNTAQGCNHQSTCMPQLQPSADLVPNVLPRRDEDSGKPCAVIEVS